MNSENEAVIGLIWRAQEKLFLDTATVLIQLLNHEVTRFNDAVWNLERSLHNLRLNAAGSSGIQHRVIQDREHLLEELRGRIEAGKKVLDSLKESGVDRQCGTGSTG